MLEIDALTDERTTHASFDGVVSLTLDPTGARLAPQSTGGGVRVWTTGHLGKPVAGDWDGDGRDSVGVRTDNRWRLWNERSGTALGDPDDDFLYGSSRHVPIAGNWNDDRFDSIGVEFVADNSAEWHLIDVRQTPLPGQTRVMRYGSASDEQLTAGDGDGIDELVVVRPGIWHVGQQLGVANGASVHDVVTL